jgi:nanoRNase/pAp phosphatase (c-di-AMP/oligoRNAs hydrolase)
MNHCRPWIALLLTLATALPALSQAASLELLEQQCEKAREAKIAPLREAAIERCISARRSSRSPAACERIYADFGQGGGTVDGGFRAPMFIDLPPCVAYFDARDQQRRNSSRR